MGLSVHTEGSDPSTQPPDDPTSVGKGEPAIDRGNNLSERSAGNEGKEQEGRHDGVRPNPSTDPVTEFSCGVEQSEMGGTSVCCRGGGGASELHQYDGVLEEGEGQNGLDCFLKPKVSAVSVMDRLTEIHGSEALSFSSALAAQVAARSHSLISMEEQTFRDDDDEEEKEGDDEEGRDRQNPEKD